MKRQLDATLCTFYFCRVILHVSGASAHHQEYLKLVRRPLVHVYTCTVLCRNKTCTVLHQVSVSFDLWESISSSAELRTCMMGEQLSLYRVTCSFDTSSRVPASGNRLKKIDARYCCKVVNFILSLRFLYDFDRTELFCGKKKMLGKLLSQVNETNLDRKSVV
jgi:hypothetical protein